MGAQSEQIKGHAKEAAGIITRNERLRAQGRADRLAGEAKETADDARRLIEGGLDKAQQALNSVFEKARNAVRGQ